MDIQPSKTFSKCQCCHLEQVALQVVISDSAYESVADEFLRLISILVVRRKVFQTHHKSFHSLAVLSRTSIKLEPPHDNGRLLVMVVLGQLHQLVERLGCQIIRG